MATTAYSSFEKPCVTFCSNHQNISDTANKKYDKRKKSEDGLTDLMVGAAALVILAGSSSSSDYSSSDYSSSGSSWNDD